MVDCLTSTDSFSLPIPKIVFSSLDYCNSIFACLPRVQIERLKRVHRAARLLIGGFARTDHMSPYMRDVLHWLPFSQLISHRIESLVWRCLSGWTPPTDVSFAALSLLVLAAGWPGGLIRPLSNNASRSFSVVGPTTGNEFPLDLKRLPNGASSQFHQLLKTFSPCLGQEHILVRILTWHFKILIGRLIDWLIKNEGLWGMVAHW